MPSAKSFGFSSSLCCTFHIAFFELVSDILDILPTEHIHQQFGDPPTDPIYVYALLSFHSLHCYAGVTLITFCT